MSDVIQTNFNGGEISPTVYGRVDLAKFANSLRTLKNFICLVHGPAQNRSGFQYIAATKGNGQARLIDFEFSITQAYILEFTNLFIRFYMNGGQIGAPYQIASPYTAAQLADIDYCQSADVMYLAHSSHYPRELTRTAHDNWTLTRHELIDGPWEDENTSATTIDPNGLTGSVSVTASTAIFTSADVDRYLQFYDGTDYHTLRITGYTSGTVVTCQVIGDDLGAHDPTTQWSWSRWGGANGWPATVTFHNDRLCWSGCPQYPQDIALSKVGIYADHGISNPLVDDDALYLTLGAKKVNVVQWIRAARYLTVGTIAAEWWLASATGDGPITAESKQATIGAFNGSSSISAVEAGKALVHLQRQNKRLQEILYNFESDSFTGEDLTLLADHLTKDYTITALAYQREPNRILWCVRSDGRLLGLTYYREHEVYGWHIHETVGDFESIATIPGATEDELWAVVKRTINGSTVRYVERLKPLFNDSDTTDAFFVDAGLSLDNRKSIVSINLTTDVVTVTAHGYADGDHIRFRVEDDPYVTAGANGSLNHMQFKVSDKTADTFKCKDIDTGSYIDFSTYTTIKSGGGNTVAKNVTSITGLSHLEGESVAILADGGQLASEVVTSGAITIDEEASVVHVGLPYVSDLETLTPEIELKSGTTQAHIKQIVSASVRLYRTVGMKIGRDENNLTDIPFLSDAQVFGFPPALFSGDKEVSFKGSHDTEARVFIRQDQPLPITILAIISDIELGDT